MDNVCPLAPPPPFAAPFAQALDLLFSSRADLAAAPPSLSTEPSAEVSVRAAPALRELNASWAEGSRVKSEDILGRHPELKDDLEATVRVIYEEICLREARGEAAVPGEILARFPQWQAELAILLQCHELLHEDSTVGFPQAGQAFGDYHLLAELGRGARGRVFLAAQAKLADRPVVLKLAALEGVEHLSLARLQHAHIVPLYLVQEFPELQLQGLCMPFLGGLTLAAVLKELHAVPLGQRRGAHLLSILNAAPHQPAGNPIRGPVRQAMAGWSFTEAMCWMGACLAEALQYAHDRGLIHLDVKPSNVLITADGQPMLLDFHLAREPIVANQPPPDWVGGTRGYMAPEQEQALEAVRHNRPVRRAVDGRADVYSLGAVLVEALGGDRALLEQHGARRLLAGNAQVSPGLASILERCLERDPARRYGSAADLAADLHRHRAHFPLRGVPNRSWRERWHKWRRRHPHTLSVAGLIGLLAAALLAGAISSATSWSRQRQEVFHDLAEGRRQLRDRHSDEAVRTFTRGVKRARRLAASTDLTDQLARSLEQAEQEQRDEELHRLVEQLRFLAVAETMPRPQAEQISSRCAAWWSDRRRFERAEQDPDTEERRRADLLDLVQLWGDVRLQWADARQTRALQQDNARMLAEAQARVPPASSVGGPRLTAWELARRGRTLLRAGELDQAERHLAQALQQYPADFWLNFYRGRCAFRQQAYDRALLCFHACAVLAPRNAECFFNRALARTALSHLADALADYDRALALNPQLTEATFNRGLLHRSLKQFPAARHDLHRARELGADPAAVYFHLALIALDESDRPLARQQLRQALRYQPCHGEARRLLEELSALD